MTNITQLKIVAIVILATMITACGPKKAGDGTTADGHDEEGGGVSSADEEYEHWMTEAGMALSEGRNQEALEAYLAAAAALDKKDAVSIERAEAHFLAADLAYQQAERELAIEEYQKSVDIYLRFTGNSKAKASVALTNMGVIQKELGDRDQARTSWEKALKVYDEVPKEFRSERNIHRIKQNINDLEFDQ